MKQTTVCMIMCTRGTLNLELNALAQTDTHSYVLFGTQSYRNTLNPGKAWGHCGSTQLCSMTKWHEDTAVLIASSGGRGHSEWERGTLKPGYMTHQLEFFCMVSNVTHFPFFLQLIKVYETCEYCNYYWETLRGIIVACVCVCVAQIIFVCHIFICTCV